MGNNKNKDFKFEDNNLENQKLSSFKSPARKQKPDDTKVGDETPDRTTQGYSEDNVIPNPDDKTKKRSLGNSKEQ